MNRRLGGTGHLIRMENSRIPKVALDAKLEGKRKFGRPVKMARRHAVTNIQVKMAGIKGWKSQGPITMDEFH
jgi:hypothetical protein